MEWIFGHHAVTTALESARRPAFELLVTDKNEHRYRPLCKGKCQLRVVGKDQLDRLTQQPHQGVALKVGALPALGLKEVAASSSLLLALDQVTDPHNLGACLRSANAFGAGGVLVPERHSAKDSPIVAKAAAGALEDTPLVVVTNLVRALDDLKKEGYWAIGLAGDATETLSKVDLSGKIVLVMGSEGSGLRPLVRQHCDVLAKLPMLGTVESLNVSVATGAALYEAVRQRQTKTSK